MSALRKTIEIARYLGKPPEEVVRMTEEDDLPHVRLQGANKPTLRFRLPDFFRWLQPRNRGCEFGNFADFKREFEEAQKVKRREPSAARS